MTILDKVLALTLALNAVTVQDLSAVTLCTGARNSGLAVNRSPDQTFSLLDFYREGVGPKEIREQLHWLAVFLKYNPDYKGFIVSYAGQSACSGEAIKRAKVAREFLLKSEGVKSKQLKIVDAGYRTKWVIELWYGHMRAKGQPLSRDTIGRSVVRITKRCRILFRSIEASSREVLLT